MIDEVLNYQILRAAMDRGENVKIHSGPAPQPKVPAPRSETKQCSACAREDVGPKSVAEFNRSTQTPDGRARHCKEHARQFVRESRKRRRDRPTGRASRVETQSIANALRMMKCPNYAG